MIKHPKYQQLTEYLQSLESVLVAFSGGVDSTFLLMVAREALDDNVLAVTVSTAYMPKWEIQEAIDFAKVLGIKHKMVNLPVPEKIKNNPKHRCYSCKHIIFKKLLETAENENIKHVIDGSNLDDLNDFRPGMKALEELNIKSPLKQVGLTKEQIRKFSRQLRLPTWDKPAYACLLTRLPYGREVKPDTLRKIEESEKVLHDLGFKAARVRDHDNLARIEVPRDDIKRLINKQEQFIEVFKTYGYEFVSVDLEGYRRGSFNVINS